MFQDPDASPVKPLPPVVVVMALAIFAVELLFQGASRGLWGGASGVGWRVAAVEDHAVFGVLVRYALATGDWQMGIVQRFVTYPFVHQSFVHMLMAVVFLLALGKMVATAMGQVAVPVLFFVAAVAGALVFSALGDGRAPLIGGYPAVYGLIGGYSWLLWVAYGRMGEPQVKAFQLIAALLAIQLVFGLFAPGDLSWVADIAGFATGFVISPLVAPGGIARLRDRLRDR